MEFIEHHELAIGIIVGGICGVVVAVLGLRAALRDAIGRGLGW